MATLNSYMKKNQKKIMAIFSAGLMIAFALPSAVSNMNKNREVTYGYAGNTKVSNKDIAEAAARWRLLKMTLIYPPDPDPAHHRPNAVAFVQGYLQDRLGFDQNQIAQIVQQFDANPESFCLLVREAEDMGVGVSEDEMNDVWNSTIHQPTADDPGDYERRAHDAIHAFLMAANASARAGDMAKVTRPQRDVTLSRMQQLGLNLVEFKASDYLPKVGQWTEQERAAKVDAQYEAYKNLPPTTQPGSTDRGASLEFGFGYQVPNEVNVEYLEVSGEAMRKLAASKVRLVDAFTYMRKNPTRFPKPLGVKPPPGVAATQPSTQPAATVPKVFSDAPTTRPLTEAEVLKYFPTYQDEIFKQLIDDQVATLTHDILAELTGPLNTDYANFKNNLPGGPTTTATSLPSSSLSTAQATKFGPYPKFEYLQKLAASVNAARMPAPTTRPAEPTTTTATTQPDSGELVRAVRSEGLLSAKQLADWGPIAKATLEGRVPFPQYATRLVDPLAGEQERRVASAAQIRVLSLYEPSASLRGEAADAPLAASADPAASRPENIFIFRVIAAVPAHAPTKDQVIEQVTADAKLVEAYNLARADAAKLVTDSQANHVRLSAAAAGAGKTVITTGLIEQLQLQPGTTFIIVPNYPLAMGPTQTIFLSGAYGLLSNGASPADTHPMGVIDMRPTATVLAGEVNQVQPRWTGQTMPTDQLLVTAYLRNQLETALRYRWFTMSDITDRMHWRAVEGAKKSSAPTPVQPPLNPLGG
jgi:hypothetical protein